MLNTMQIGRNTTGTDFKKTNDYLLDLNPLQTTEGELMHFKKEMQEDSVPVITDDVLQLIHVLILSHKIQSVLEVGTAVGASAMLFASFMGEGGRVTTIERDDNYYFNAVENIRKRGYENQITVHHTDAVELLKTLEGPYDMIFLDGAKAHYITMLDDCVRLLKNGGLLVADNVLFRGMVSGEAPLIRRKITIVKRLRKFLTEINNRDGIESCVLPIGDGLSISVKKF